MWHDAGGDDDVFTDLCNGFPVIGEVPPSGAFPFKEAPAGITVGMLMKVAKWAQKALANSTKGSGDNELDKEVYRTTIGEKDKGWLQGPFTAEEISSRLGGVWVPSRRFGIQQGGKTRNIDDYSEYLVNSSFGSWEKIEVGGVDEICGAARTFIKLFMGNKAMATTLSTGEVLRGSAHQDWIESGCVLSGRLLDLSHAYKQLFSRGSHQWACVVGV